MAAAVAAARSAAPDLSDKKVTGLLDPFYNGILAFILILWIWNVRLRGVSRLVEFLKARRLWVGALLWAAFIVFAASFVVEFGYFDEIHDIDEAVNGGSAAVGKGINPYVEPVVPRFKEKYDEDIVWTMGTYNYLPVDLLVYSGARFIAGDLGSPVWFVTVNLLLSGIALYILHDLLRVRWFSYAPLAGIVMLFYAFDNASLTLLLMVLSMLAWRRLQSRPALTAITIMSLAALTKVYAVIPLAVMVLFELQGGLSKRDWPRVANALASVALGVAIAVAVIAPFGFNEVLDSAVFFHTSEDARAGTSYGGALLAEIALESDYYSLIAVAAVGVALLGSLWIPNLCDRVILVTAAFLLVSVKSSLGPLTIAGLFLALRIRDLADERRAAEAQSGKEAATGERTGSGPGPA